MIVCGTDFSEAALAAASVAAYIAALSGEAVQLVCASGEREIDVAAGTEGAIRSDPGPVTTSARLESEVARLHGLGARVDGIIDPSSPDRALVERSRLPATSLLVLGAVGHTLVERVLLGSVAERVAMGAVKPVLVVRDAAPWAQWAGGKRPLRILLAFDVGSSASTALDWVRQLRRLGDLQLTICWVVNPAQENKRVGATGPGAGVELLPKCQETLWHEFRRMVGEEANVPTTELRLEPTLGRIDSALTMVARETNQDLLVVGSHQRQGFERLWHTSVSRGVLRHAAMSVAVAAGS
ncbi:MAG: universal stress protein [Gemmatimonadota bacterium]